MRRRLGLADPEEGVYAILYAILAVVLIGMAAIVVDFASVRQDRRLDRAAADSAALGGVKLLDYGVLSAVDPQQACLRAWSYLSSTLHISIPAGACNSFAGVSGSSCWSGGITNVIADDRTVNGRTYRIAWPIPAGADQGFLTPDLAPGNVNQPGNTAATPGPTNTDGYANGCDKLGVAVFLNQSFGLAGALGYNGTNTQVHSVARVVPNAGPPGNAAALNVLADDCETLTAKGGGSGGFVFVGPVINSAGAVIGPGTIAVESSANACTGGNTAIDVTGGNLVCASQSAVSATTCTGDGVILDHALDPGMQNGSAYTGNAAQLKPTPTAEQGTEGYIPVTKYYGCNALPSCQAPTTNYIQQLVAAYGGSGKPSAPYGASQAPYPSQSAFTFTDVSSQLCPGGSGISGVPVIIAAGYNYANCTVKIASSGVLIVQGGTLVINGGIQNSGCFVMNAALSTCPTGADLSNTGTARVTTTVKPVADAQVFLRGNSCPANKCFDNQGTLVFPQTFVFNKASTEPLNQAGSASGLTLWTAPDAGDVDGSGNTTLDNLCGATPSCIDSRFGRLTYWSESALTTSNPNVFVGQGNLNVVGIFFTPLAAFKFGGGSGYASAAAQFWSAYLTVGGGAQLGLSPIDKFSRPPLGPHLVLIR